MRIITIIVPVLLGVANEACAKDWKVFCMPEKHLDVGWAYLPADAIDQGYPGSVEDFQNFITLRALFMRGATQKFPADARYRWTFDAAWQLEQARKYLPSQMPEIRRLVNCGEFAYNPIYAHLHSMYLTHEQLLRMMNCATELERQGFRRSYTALHADVPTVSWGYASALASAGVKYLLKGTWYNSPYNRNLAQVAPAPLFRWTGPDGRKVLLFYYEQYAVLPQSTNMGPPSDKPPEAVVEASVQRYEKLAAEGKWPYDAFPMFGSEGDWGVPDRTQAELIYRWNKSHPSVRLRMSTPEEFFEYIETHFADRIPDGGVGGWGISYDLVEGNAVKPGANARQNDHLLLSAEALATVANLRFGAPYPVEPLREAWKKQVLYHEHSFGMRDGPGPEGRRQYAWKTRLTEQSAAIAKAALEAALQTLAAQIPSNGEDRVAVFNSLSFPQSETVEMAIAANAADDALQVVDVDQGREVPSHVVRAGAKTLLRFRAEDVPGVGYRSYRIVRGAPSARSQGVLASAAERRLENDFYRLTLAADGTIISLLDKQLKCELFDADSPYRGNQFIFKDHTWKDASPQSARVQAIGLGALGAALEVEAAPTSIFPAIRTRYTLAGGLKRLDIENQFTKEPGRSGSHETVFYAFPFAIPHGEFFLDIPGVVARYPKDFRPETDWSIMPAQSFVAIANQEVTAIVATREAPNFEFSAMRKFFDHPTQPDLATTTVFAQPHTKQTVNNDDYDLEGGTYAFHYAITSRAGPFKAADAVRCAANFQRGLLPVMLTSRQGSLPTTGSFMAVDSERVVLSTLQKADDGRGLIVRLWNPSDDARSVKVSFPGGSVVSATATDSLARGLEQSYEVRDQAVTVPVGRDSLSRCGLPSVVRKEK